MDTFEPKDPRHQATWNLLSEKTREGHLAKARERERIVCEIRDRPPDESERAAVRRSGADRTWYRRWARGFAALGLEGLIDWRGASESPMPAQVLQAILTLRRASPDIAVEAIVAHVQSHHGYSVSTSVVKRRLAAAGLARRGGAPSRSRRRERRLEFGGVKLLEAAAVATGYLEALATGTREHMKSVARPQGEVPEDTQDRDEYGRFESGYNDRYFQGSTEPVGPGFQSVDAKRPGMDPERWHVMGAGVSVIERKLWGLMVSPLLGTGRWDGLRSSQGSHLGELCGFEYMPSTLELFTRELKFAGVSGTLWEVHARLVYRETSAWGEATRAAVIYADATEKGVATKLFAQATPVSGVNRVMPGMDVIAFHSGYGVPLWMVSHSGRAPLVKAVPALLRRLNAMLGDTAIGRIVIIDAEANSIPFLRGLESESPGRAWSTRLRPSMLNGKKPFDWGDFCDYRDGDQVRVGLCDLKDAEGKPFRIRLVEIKRRTKGTSTFIAASVLLGSEEWSGGAIADLYFDRWPMQEANFKAVNQAVNLKQVHGYGKQRVLNVAVIHRLDTIDQRLRDYVAKLEVIDTTLVNKDAEVRAQHTAMTTMARRQRTIETRLDATIQKGEPVNARTQRLWEERRQLAASHAKIESSHERLVDARAKDARTRDTLHNRISALTKEREVLDSRRVILAHDTELDSIFNVLKVGFVFLVTWLLKTIAPDVHMNPVTFLDRVASLPATSVDTPTHQILTFDYNRRDPEVMGVLIAAVEPVNARSFRLRDGRVLRIAVLPPPPPRRPRPPNSRAGSGDRFR